MITNCTDFIKSHLKIISIIFLLFLFVSYIKLWLGMDETYTLDLIHNSYKMIIIKDTYDVHPPLYYLLLKLFFQITLFWKHSIIAEIVMGEVLSIICSILTVHYLIKINNKLGIIINKYVQYIMFFLSPIVLFAGHLNLSPAINIRMYALSGLFATLVCYYLICYLNDYKIKNVIFMTLYSIMAEYTNYYVAVIVGLILLFMFLFFLYKSEYRSAVIFLLSGIVFLIVFIPWIIFAIPRQFSILNYGQTLSQSLINIFIALVIILVCVVLLFILRHYIYGNIKIYILLLTLINVIILTSTAVYTVLKSPIFLFRYIYPALAPLFYMVISLSLYNILNKKIKIKLSVCFLAIICVGAIFSYVDQMVKITPISVIVLKNDNYFGNRSNKNVNIDHIKYGDMKDDVHSYMSDKVQLGIYLKSIGKVPYVTTRKDAKYNNNYAPNQHTMHKFVYYRK